MSFQSTASSVTAILFTAASIIMVAGNHNALVGALFGAAAVGFAITSINLSTKESFRAAIKEVSKEIGPTEAGSPVAQAKPAPKL
jgi:hypothetical protein